MNSRIAIACLAVAFFAAGAAACDSDDVSTKDITTPDVISDTAGDTTADTAPDAVADATPDVTSDAVPDAAPDAVADAVPDATPDAVADAVPDATPDAVADAVPDATPDAVPDATPDAVADTTPDTTETPLNGCTMAEATDRTGESAVSLTDISAWTLPHKACIIVDEGTVVTWSGNFTFHPLTGGETPTPDATSPITIAGPGTGTTDIAVTFTTAGSYPYYCLVHLSSMQGVVYVVAK
ncbi:MAG: hypothetical protein H6744_13530 [Deltaproteobacteria bacterium]|nr:hypothetical protein [Deltaproteobacteria bacterium]